MHTLTHTLQLLFALVTTRYCILMTAIKSTHKTKDATQWGNAADSMYQITYTHTRTRHRSPHMHMSINRIACSRAGRQIGLHTNCPVHTHKNARTRARTQTKHTPLPHMQTNWAVISLTLVCARAQFDLVPTRLRVADPSDGRRGHIDRTCDRIRCDFGRKCVLHFGCSRLPQRGLLTRNTNIDNVEPSPRLNLYPVTFKLFNI